MNNDVTVYVNVLKDSLVQKKQVLEKLEELTAKQQQIVDEDEISMDAFEACMEDKETYIERLMQLERGFEHIYERVSEEIKAEPDKYKADILQMQELIRGITELSTRIQVLEKQNKTKLDNYFKEQRKEIRGARQNTKVADSYYQNMANQPGLSAPQFMDQKQ